jgi:hypothetical protein
MAFTQSMPEENHRSCFIGSSGHTGQVTLANLPIGVPVDGSDFDRLSLVG